MVVGLVQLKCGSVRTQSTGFYRGRTCIPRYVLASVGFLSWVSRVGGGEGGINSNVCM